MTQTFNAGRAGDVGDGSELPPGDDSPPSSGGAERRASSRYPVMWPVDCTTEDTFLYASITNISELGIFVRTEQPLAVGTRITLAFQPDPAEPVFHLAGVVQCVNHVRPLSDNPNPGMGVHFDLLSAEDRERIVEVIHTIAYVRDGRN